MHTITRPDLEPVVRRAQAHPAPPLVGCRRAAKHDKISTDTDTTAKAGHHT